MSYFPMMVDLAGRKVLVIGGGKEGSKKINILHEFGCRITLISRKAEPEAVKFSDVFINRDFEDSDINEDYAIIVAATDDAELNERIFNLAYDNKIPVNIVDNAMLCTFIFPAIIKDEDVVISVSSGGNSPYIAQYIKNIIRGVLPQNIGKINKYMGELRIQAKRDIPDREERNRFLKSKLKEALGEEPSLS